MCKNLIRNVLYLISLVFVKMMFDVENTCLLDTEYSFFINKEKIYIY